MNSVELVTLKTVRKIRVERCLTLHIGSTNFRPSAQRVRPIKNVILHKVYLLKKHLLDHVEIVTVHVLSLFILLHS